MLKGYRGRFAKYLEVSLRLILRVETPRVLSHSSKLQDSIKLCINPFFSLPHLPDTNLVIFIHRFLSLHSTCMMLSTSMLSL